MKLDQLVLVLGKAPAPLIGRPGPMAFKAEFLSQQSLPLKIAQPVEGLVSRHGAEPRRWPAFVRAV